MTNTENELEHRKALTQEQIDFFAANGYLKFGKILDDDEIEVLRVEYDRMFAEARQSGRFRNLAIDNTEDLEEKNTAQEQMLQIMQMCERSLDFRRLIFNERILDIAEDLIGPNIRIFSQTVGERVYAITRRELPNEGIIPAEDNVAAFFYRPHKLLEGRFNVTQVRIRIQMILFKGSHER